MQNWKNLTAQNLTWYLYKIEHVTPSSEVSNQEVAFAFKCKYCSSYHFVLNFLRTMRFPCNQIGAIWWKFIAINLLVSLNLRNNSGHWKQVHPLMYFEHGQACAVPFNWIYMQCLFKIIPKDSTRIANSSNFNVLFRACLKLYKICLKSKESHTFSTFIIQSYKIQSSRTVSATRTFVWNEKV